MFLWTTLGCLLDYGLSMGCCFASLYFSVPLCAGGMFCLFALFLYLNDPDQCKLVKRFVAYGFLLGCYFTLIVVLFRVSSLNGEFKLKLQRILKALSVLFDL